MDLASIGPLSIAFILATIAVGAFIKGVTGLGLPIFAIPVFALFVPIDSAVVIMALPALVANIQLVVAHRKQMPLMGNHSGFLIAGFVGALIGTWVLKNFNDEILRTLLAAWLGVYLLQHFTGRATSGIFSGSNGLSGPLGLAAGALQGTTGISAPIIAPYFHARGLTLSAYAFAVAFAFALFSVAQMSAMTAFNLLTPTLLTYSVIATIATMIFIQLGVKFSGRLSRETFERFLPLLFVLIETKLIYDIFV